MVIKFSRKVHLAIIYEYCLTPSYFSDRRALMGNFSHFIKMSSVVAEVKNVNQTNTSIIFTSGKREHEDSDV